MTEEILLGKVLDVSRNQIKGGGRVYNPQDTELNKRKAVLRHLSEAVEPGGLTGLMRMYKAYENKEGKLGTTYDVKTEAIAQGTGVRVSKLDVPRSLSFKAYRFRRDLMEASALARKKGVKFSFNQKKKLFDEFSETIGDAMITGMRSDEILDVLARSGVSRRDAFSLVNGTYDRLLDIKMKRAEVRKGRRGK
jgi:hypothetical protein